MSVRLPVSIRHNDINRSIPEQRSEPNLDGCRQILVIVIEHSEELGINGLAARQPRDRWATCIEIYVTNVTPSFERFNGFRYVPRAIHDHDRKNQAILIL
jgi:hypothetical protein